MQVAFGLVAVGLPPPGALAVYIGMSFVAALRASAREIRKKDRLFVAKESASCFCSSDLSHFMESRYSSFSTMSNTRWTAQLKRWQRHQCLYVRCSENALSN